MTHESIKKGHHRNDAPHRIKQRIQRSLFCLFGTEDVDHISRRDGDNGTLLVITLTIPETSTLRFALAVQSVHAQNFNAEDLLHSIFHFSFVRSLGDLESVLAQIRLLKALLGNYRSEQNVVRVFEVG